MAKIFVLCSASGSGKTTIREEALKRIPNLHKVITMTSRAPREGEIDGIDYHFRSPNEMQESFAHGELLEMVTSYNNLYGTPSASFDDPLREGKNLIIILDVYGKINLDKFFDNVGIFIEPPSPEILKRRLIDRLDVPSDEDLKNIDARVDRAKEEKLVADAIGFDYKIDGTLSINQCVNLLISIIEHETT